jgi:hypothetical protein
VKVVQVSPSHGELCGVAVFGDSMSAALASAGLEVQTVTAPAGALDADIFLVQYHSELTTHDELAAILDWARGPVVVVAHSPGLARQIDRLAGVLVMVDGLVPDDASVPVLAFRHPAYTPAALCERSSLRTEFGLPTGSPIVATSGFLRFDRRFPEVLARLLPGAAQLGWGVQLVTSPWRTPSPGLLQDLAELRAKYTGRFWHVHEHLPEETLNRRLQAADLLWCWSPPSTLPYASGVVSQLYGSGSRVVAADRVQHEQVFGLPGVVRAPGDLPAFVKELLRQMRNFDGVRHDPAAISWERQIRPIARFLTEISNRTGVL